MSRFRPSHIGFFGKLPAYGDFVQTGLPEDTVAPLDFWCRVCLTESRAALGTRWERAWMTAPIWRFLLPPGACGVQAVLGVWLPSMDKVGRHYPFILIAMADDPASLLHGNNWLALAEAEGLAGVVEDRPHPSIAAALVTPVADAPVTTTGWWTTGSPFVRPHHLEVPALLPAATHAGGMLYDHHAAEDSC